MNSADIIQYLLTSLHLNKDDKDKDSYYGEYRIGGNSLVVIRISNHRTFLNTWDERYKPTQQANKKIIRRMGRNLPDIFRNKTFYSFVFEDTDTVGNTEVPSKRKIVVNESTYKATDIKMELLNSLKDAIHHLSRSGEYNNAILGQYSIVSNREDCELYLLKELIKEFKIRNNQIYNYRNMNTNKKTIRLTESKLRNIITESVKRVVKENFEEEWYHWDDDIITLDPQDGESMILSCQGSRIEVDGRMPLYDAVTQIFRKLHY